MQPMSNLSKNRVRHEMKRSKQQRRLCGRFMQRENKFYCLTNVLLHGSASASIIGATLQTRNVRYWWWFYGAGGGSGYGRHRAGQESWTGTAAWRSTCVRHAWRPWYVLLSHRHRPARDACLITRSANKWTVRSSSTSCSATRSHLTERLG